MWSNRGLVLELLRRDEEALAAFDRSLSLDSKNIETWDHKIAHLHSRGRLEESEACRREALRSLGRLKAWGVCLVDQGGKPVAGSEIGVETDMPPELVAQQFVQMLAQKGHTVGSDGLVDGKYGVALWEVPEEAVQVGG